MGDLHSACQQGKIDMPQFWQPIKWPKSRQADGSLKLFKIPAIQLKEHVTSKIVNMAPRAPSAAALQYLARCLRTQSDLCTTQRQCKAFNTQICHQLAKQRTYATYSPISRQNGSVGGPRQQRPRPAAVKEPIYREFVLDEDIPAREVQLKDPQTGKLNDPQPLFSILRTLDRDTQVVRALAQPPGAPAIVEVSEKSALVARLKAKEEAAAEIAKEKRQSKPKQIELNWAISGHDLEMKIKQLRQFVDKGRIVEILLAAKKRQRRATPEEADNVLAELRKAIAETEGCKEIKPMQGRVGGQASLIVQKQGK